MRISESILGVRIAAKVGSIECGMDEMFPQEMLFVTLFSGGISMQQGWLYSPIVDRGIVAGCALITLGCVIWLTRTFMKDMREERRAREEEKQRYKAFRHRARATILQAQEWNVDATPLQEAVRRADLTSMAARMMEREKTLAVLPLIPFLVFMSLFGATGVPWLLVVTLVVLALSLPWEFIHVRRWRLLNRYIHALFLEQQQAAERDV